MEPPVELPLLGVWLGEGPLPRLRTDRPTSLCSQSIPISKPAVA